MSTTPIRPFSFSTSKTILFGEGRSRDIGSVLAGLGIARPLVVTDAGLVKIGLVAPIQDAIAAQGCAVTTYDGVLADPPEAIIDEAVAAGRTHRADGVVGLGGGSSLDVAKLVALVLKSGETLASVYGVGNAKGPRLPLVLIPTTSGTGSEVTPISIVTTGTNEKKGVVSPVILPDVALLDPDLTLGLPAPVTAATGIDAMVHAIEAYASISPNNNPLSRGLARDALRLLGGALLTAVKTGHDKAARSAMLLGSMLAGQAFANSPVAAVHALAYPIGGHFHVPHGLSNALVLPHVIAFNLPAAGPVYAEIAADLFPVLADLPAAARAERFVTELAGLAPACGLPARLRDVGIPETALTMMAADAMKQTRLLVNNPRPLTEADALAIYRAAW